MTDNLTPINPEYVYMTIPAEYVCVYHRILAMLADYGEEMLKDCKATCTERNSGVIECFNMFNAAVAARKLGKDSLANALITYIKAKINQIYGGVDNSTSFVFPVDEEGHLKAFVSCGERPKFEIAPDSGQLYEHKLGNGFEEHFHLGPEDGVEEGNETGLVVYFRAMYEVDNGVVHPCAEVTIFYNGKEVSLEDVDFIYYFDSVPVVEFRDIDYVEPNETHTFSMVVKYAGEIKIINQAVTYEES